jgi:hypothetical protein
VPRERRNGLESLVFVGVTGRAYAGTATPPARVGINPGLSLSTRVNIRAATPHGAAGEKRPGLAAAKVMTPDAEKKSFRSQIDISNTTV